MNLRLSSLAACFSAALFASCTPYNEHQGKKPTQKPAEKTVSSPEQQKLQAQRDAMKEKEKQATKTEGEVKPTPTEAAGGTTAPSNPTPTPPVEEKRQEYKFANKVPGKDGFVFSPYNNKVVDVRDIPSGTLVQDPTYTGAGKGYFRVP
jgi:hypothetical protein